MPNLSPEFVENMRALLGAQTDAFLAALEDAPALAMRVHRPGADVSRFVEGAVPWASGGYYLRPGAAHRSSTRSPRAGSSTQAGSMALASCR